MKRVSLIAYSGALLMAAAVLGILLGVSASAFAQDQEEKKQPQIKASIGYANLNVAGQNLPGATGSFDWKLPVFDGGSKWRLGFVADASYHYDTGVNGGPSSLDRYLVLFGTRLSRDFADDKLSVFAGAQFGATIFNAKNGGRDLTRTTVGPEFGLDVNFGKFFWRPAHVKFLYIDERATALGPVRYTQFGTGIGFRR